MIKLSKSVEKQIEAIYKEVFKKIYTRKTFKALITGSRKDVKKLVLGLTESDEYDKFAKKFAKSLAKKGLAHKRGVWRKYFRAAQRRRHGVFAKTYSEFQHRQLTKAVYHNFTMIKTIPHHVLEVSKQKYMQALKQQVLSGEIGRKSFERELRKKGATNAKMIARTEAAKLQTAIMENRAKDLGSVAYIWLSSNDVRTRRSHRNMNGVVVFWRNADSEKPQLDKMQGNAGEFPNCRCSTEPILDERDITKSIYRVYDYRTKKIIQLTKHQLIESLKQGEIT